MPAELDETRVRQIALGYLAELRRLLEEADLDALSRIVQRLRVARDAGATIYIAGNGGSAATASHLVNDLNKAATRSGRRPMRVIGLVDSVPWITALANDEGYDRIFSGQIENLARRGDILIVISASGNSPNLVRAVEAAHRGEVTTIGFLGFDGGALKTLVAEFVWVPTQKGAYGLVESTHAVLCDIVTTCLMQDRPGSGEAGGDQ
jgi:D-sedoheptulose 7-phosphate isomerase